MAKESTSTNSSRTASAKPAEVKPTMVPVFNHTNHSIGIALRNRKAGTPGKGAEARVVKFLPANNSIDSRDLELCQAHPDWWTYVDRLERTGLVGKKYKGVELEVGMHDEDLAVEATQLGDRMQQLHEKRVG